MGSTCPVTTKYHTTFGMPIDRQEISVDIENSINTDVKREESGKMLGRSDTLYFHKQSGLNLVKDDFGVHIMWDAAFIDMRALEKDLLKICSYYIAKFEPCVDSDIQNIYPLVDRQIILAEALELEAEFQNAKMQLVLQYIECYEHTSDDLEQ